MALLEFKVELRSLVAELQRIASALERAYPEPAFPKGQRRPTSERDVSVVTNEKLWEAEQED
jgi:hypothetical protein